jgi:hypothetical protein
MRVDPQNTNIKPWTNTNSHESSISQKLAGSLLVSSLTKPRGNQNQVMQQAKMIHPQPCIIPLGGRRGRWPNGVFLACTLTSPLI